MSFSFSDNPSSVAIYEDLVEWGAAWHTHKPTTFAPIYYSDPSNNANTTTAAISTPQTVRSICTEADVNPVFPELWYLNDLVITGLAHYHLSQILLLAHDPRLPRLGPRRAAALRDMDAQIRAHVRVLCGFAMSNDTCPPHFVCACMALALAGDKMTNRREQEACLEVMRICEDRYAYHTHKARKQLIEAWDWRHGSVASAAMSGVGGGNLGGSIGGDDMGF